MPGNLAIGAGKETGQGKEAARDSDGQRVRNILGYGRDPISKLPQTAKISASDLPHVKGMEDVELHWRVIKAFRNL